MRRYHQRRTSSGKGTSIVLSISLFSVSLLGFTILKYDPPSINTTGQQQETNNNSITSLHPGDSGTSVVKMQEWLADLGYFDDGEVTGYFGDATTASLQFFQRENGLSVDGVAGTSTLALLYSGQAKAYMMNKGDSGSDVVQLQRRLTELNYYTGADDGIFGASTLDAVKAFQHKNELIADGKVGEKTFALIYSSKAKAAVASGSAQSVESVNSMLQFAQKQLGKKYILGDEGPDSFDCSGLVYYCLKHAGVNIGRLTALGYSNVDKWKDVEKSKLMPGDILFFGVMGNGIVGHTGIYLGNNKMIEGSSTYGEVVIADLSESYWVENYISAKRVF